MLYVEQSRFDVFAPGLVVLLLRFVLATFCLFFTWILLRQSEQHSN